MVGKKKSAKSAAVRQAERNKKITDAKLVQRKVVGHPEDFDKIRKYAKNLYEKRGLSLD